jgi:anti-anti-sigma factor
MSRTDVPATEVSLSWFHGLPVVTLTGEFDTASSPMVRAAVFEALEDRPRRLVIDMARVSFVDYCGMGVLVAAHERQRDRSGDVTLVRPPPTVDRVLHVHGLPASLLTYDSLEQAADGPD